MVGRGRLSDCGEECEIQLSASHPTALTLCVPDHRLAPSHYDKLHIAPSHKNYHQKIKKIPPKKLFSQ